MRNELISNIENPEKLEQLYRGNKTDFKREFNSLYPELKDSPIAKFWHTRLNFEMEATKEGSKNELIFIVVASLLAGLVAKFPVLFGMDEEYFYARHIGFIVFPFLTAYFLWKNNLSIQKSAVIIGITLVCLVYINLLPQTTESDTLVLACLHLPLLLWSVWSVAFAGDIRQLPGRLSFLRFNGDLLVMAAILVFAGGLMSAITINLFDLIGLQIEEFYAGYVLVFGAAAIPLVGTYLTRSNPQLVGKVSPVIAKLFSPVVLVMLVIYLIAIAYAGKDPFNDREFLLVFNLLLVGVMALIFFSVAEGSKQTTPTGMTWVLFLLSSVTVIVNGVALSAILFRISEWGITPNRLAVLGANMLMIVHLLFVTAKLLQAVRKKAALSHVGETVVRYLPVYFGWTLIIVFLFPYFFGFR